MLKQLDTLIGLAVVMSVVSMLIMVATQTVSAVLALRGKNLRSALEALFVTLVPDLDSKKAQALAEVILKRPIISDSSLSLKGRMPESWKLASAIRPEECLNAIRKIAVSQPDVLKRCLSLGAQDAVGDAKDAAKQVLAALHSPEAAAAADNAMAAVKAVAPNAPELAGVEAHVNVLLAHTAASAQNEAQIWASRFQTAQDRANQWFTMHARRATIVLAFVTAFVLQLDAFQLFSRLANDADLRNQLVNLSPSIQKHVDEALNVNFPGTVYAAALKEVCVKDKISAKPAEADGATDATARQWLIGHDGSGALSDYDFSLEQNSRQRADAAKEEFNKMVGLYDQTSLQLIPEHYPLAFDTSRPFVHHVDALLGWTGGRPHKAFVGMFATAMLLTLGAPFWFNLLKGLSSLRSSVSEKIDSEQKQGQPT